MVSPTRQPRRFASGGNLARAYSTRAGLSRYPTRTSQGAPCSVPLTRDARSRRDIGAHCARANRAVCMRKGRGLAMPLQWLPLHFSFPFREAAHEFRAHNANRHQPSRLKDGAAGRVQRTSPRLSIFLEVDDFTHRGGSTVSLPSISESKRRSFHHAGERFHERAC
jgi:hypothetical protein